ncbi:DUF1634 domain-containing protein [Acinetobacter sp. NigerLNRRAM0016]
MMIIFGMTCILLGMWCLHLLSSKQIDKTKQSQWHFLTHYPQYSSSIAYILFLIAAAIFIKKFGISIGFISWWLFASPVILFLILLMNDLKQKDKPQKHRF